MFDMVRFTGYGVIAEKPRVGQLGRIILCTLYEKLCVGSKKMDETFLMVLTFSAFFQKGLFFQMYYIVLIFVARWHRTQFSRNCGQKLRKVQKSAEKFVRTTSYR